MEVWHALHEALLRERSRNSELVHSNAELVKRNSELMHSNADMRKERKKMVEVMGDLTAQLQEARGREVELKEKAGKLEQECEEKGREVETVLLRSDMLQDGITDANQQMCDLRGEKEELERRVAFLEGQPAHAQATAEMIKRWLAEQMSEKKKIEMCVLEAKYKEAMERISALEMERDVLVGVIGVSGQNSVNALTRHESNANCLF
jgi:chromosome segregation ATPase